MRGFRVATIVACIGLFAASAQGQTYPTKPVTIVVSLAAGGAADVIARAIAQRLSDEWNQPVLMADRDFREKFLTPNFYEPISSSPEEFAEHIRSDAVRWRQVISDARIAIDE